jgi:hypothetical protein
MKTEYYKENDLMPAIPPEDYKGSVADWMVTLVERGLWDDSDGSWYGDVEIPCSVWWEILEQCEKK